MAPGRTVAQGIRLLLLLAMLFVLPTTSGWITVYVVAGIVIFVSGLCCLANCCCQDCCTDCLCGAGPCCDPGGACACDCGCEDPCAGCADCGDCGCGDGCCDCGGDCGCATASDLGPVHQALPLLALGIPAARAWKIDRALAHHPFTPRYEADVYPVGPLRLCIGCWTTYPAFLAAFVSLHLLAPAGWLGWSLAGLALAALQGISSAGLARRRSVKVAIKTALGLGLAMFVHGVLSAPWLPWQQSLALLAALALALTSAIPRALRMRSCGH